MRTFNVFLNFSFARVRENSTSFLIRFRFDTLSTCFDISFPGVKGKRSLSYSHFNISPRARCLAFFGGALLHIATKEISNLEKLANEGVK
jgi:hypothetical protein